MRMDRRTVLTGLAGAAGLALGGGAFALMKADNTARQDLPSYLSARGDDDGGYYATGFSRDGRILFDERLPGRGHAAAVHGREGKAVFFARRPDTFALAIDLSGATEPRLLTSPEGRHFYGHGFFTPDGNLLYATENDYDGQRGVIGIYDVRDGYRRIAELDAHGIGPHEIRLMPDGNTMAVGIGGILTHPDSPRVKLNLPALKPSLAYIDRRDGALLGKLRLSPAEFQLSLRHLAVGKGGVVAVAAQDQAPAGSGLRPLVVLHRPGERELTRLAMPETALRGLEHYCGSVSFDVEGRVLAVSAPRGGVLVFWDAETGRFLSTVAVPDGCGLAAAGTPGTFVATSGDGAVMLVDARRGEIRPLPLAGAPRAHWDNHLTEIA